MAEEKKEKVEEKKLESVLRPGTPVSKDSVIHGRRLGDPQAT